jgi:AcrR family transcriptional regulator
MSGNKKKATGKADKRVLRTRDALGDAVIALMQEKHFEEVTVQHVLDRAGVSRSTFYAHYSGKDDLFMSDVEDFFQMMVSLLERNKEQSDRVVPVAEMLAHFGEMGEFVRALNASGKLYDVMEMGRGLFAQGIEQRLGAQPEGKKLSALERAASAEAFAGAFISLAMWWIARGKNVTPQQMDAMYHKLVWRGVRGVVN